MKRFLITTADERTWTKDQPVLFLGEWCKLYDRHHIWTDMDAKIVPYHWNDRKKLHRDYLYLRELYEKLLRELAERLNDVHGSNNSLRYWRILIGPWLCFFVEMMFDRWEMIRKSVADYTIVGGRILDTARDQVVPNDMACFNSLYLEDFWNEAIYGQLLNGWTTVPLEKVKSDMRSPISDAQPKLTISRLLKCMLSRKIAIVSHKVSGDNDAFFLSTYLPRRQDLLLQLRLGQIPQIWNNIPTPKVAVDWSKRQWQLGCSFKERFPAIMRVMIARHIPTIYLEGYKELQKVCNGLPWPSKPRFIFTSNSCYPNDVFKAWAAKKVEESVPLVVGQHGGNYGIGHWESSEEHQFAISDCWLSWGWSDKNRPHIKPVCNLKMVGCNLRWDPAGYVLLVEMTVPRYSYRMFSVPVASQWLGYFEDQCRFVTALPEWIRSKLIVRLQQQDYGWCQKQRWKDRYPNIRLDEGQASIAPLIKKSRVYVSTYNASTFLESMAMNIPTIVFWNPDHWELRDSAVPYFERLKAVGIFHDTPETAAHKLTQIWDDVAAWWNSEPVQTVHKEFCYRYSRMPEKPLKDLEQVLRQISKTVIE